MRFRALFFAALCLALNGAAIAQTKYQTGAGGVSPGLQYNLCYFSANGSNCSGLANGAGVLYQASSGVAPVWSAAPLFTTQLSSDNSTKAATTAMVQAAIAAESAPPYLTGTTGTITPGPLAAGACGSGTAMITGVTTAMAIAVTPVAYPGDGAWWEGYVSGTNTVTVKVCSSIIGTPGASAYNVRALQ